MRNNSRESKICTLLTLGSEKYIVCAGSKFKNNNLVFQDKTQKCPEGKLSKTPSQLAYSENLYPNFRFRNYREKIIYLLSKYLLGGFRTF